MATRDVTPQVGSKSFSCPHCGALAHQEWFSISCRPATKPSVNRAGDVSTGETTVITKISMAQLKIEATHMVSNSSMSQCYSCKGIAVWLGDRLMHPVKQTLVEPHEDMPPNIRDDFREAASIVELSPRGAAAPLRLCLQKLMVDLGETGKNINEDIKSLVAKGLEPEIQKALDVVRVIGNNAVHPGELDLTDDKAIATTLLTLINIIVERRIAAKKRIDEMFQSLPKRAREAIEKRDS